LIDRPPTLLRRGLLADAVASGAVGVLLIVAAGFLEGLLDIPGSFLFWAGVILLPYVAFVIFVATRGVIPAGGAWTVVILNVLWTVASAYVLVGGVIAPNTLGNLFVIGQAAVVALLGVVQYFGLQQMTA
jgi:hypothetical protein